MSQPVSSKPAVAASYFKAAAKALRLQKPLHRSGAKKNSTSSSSSFCSLSKSNNSSMSISEPCTPTIPSFQHSNGRRLSYDALQHHSQHRYHHTNNHHYHHHRSTEQQHLYDSPLNKVQRRRNTSGGMPNSLMKAHHCPSSTVAVAMAMSTSKNTLSYSTSSHSTAKICRQSSPPSQHPVITIHHYSTHQQHGSSTSLIHSNSMPNRRRKRHSYQQTATLTVEQPSPWSVAPAPVVDHSSQLVRSHTSADLKPVGTKDRTAALHQNQHQRQEQTQIQSNSRPDPAYSSIAALYQNAGSASASPSSSSNTDSECDVGDVEQAVLDQAQHSTDPIPVPLVTSESHHLQKPFPQTKAALQPVNLPRRYTSFSSAKPTRSMTNTSLSSNSSHNSSLSTMSSVSSADSTAMRLVDSSMSIRSQMSSESSSTLLSAAIAASGLPSMDKMMDQVDRSIATDSQAQWVENVHVGLVAQVSFVDTQLIVEPCSATVETWVN